MNIREHANVIANETSWSPPRSTAHWNDLLHDTQKWTNLSPNVVSLWFSQRNKITDGQDAH